jgi:hypothetical protein
MAKYQQIDVSEQLLEDLVRLRIPVIVSSDSGRNVSTDSGAS